MNNEPAKSSSLTARTTWLIFAKTLAFAFGFALPLLLVRRLNLADFGLYKQAFLVIGTASGILPLGFATSAFYFLPREREKRGAIVLNIVLFNAVVGGVGVLILLLAPQSLRVSPNPPSCFGTFCRMRSHQSSPSRLSRSWRISRLSWRSIFSVSDFLRRRRAGVS